MYINEIVAEKTREVEKYARLEREARAAIELILSTAKAEGRSALTRSEDTRAEVYFSQIKSAKENRENAEAALNRAKAVQSEENSLEERLNESRPNSTRSRSADSVTRVGRESRAENTERDGSWLRSSDGRRRQSLVTRVSPITPSSAMK